MPGSPFDATPPPPAPMPMAPAPAPAPSHGFPPPGSAFPRRSGLSPCSIPGPPPTGIALPNDDELHICRASRRPILVIIALVILVAIGVGVLLFLNSRGIITEALCPSAAPARVASAAAVTPPKRAPRRPSRPSPAPPRRWRQWRRQSPRPRKSARAAWPRTSKVRRCGAAKTSGSCATTRTSAASTRKFTAGWWLPAPARSRRGCVSGRPWAGSSWPRRPWFAGRAAQRGLPCPTCRPRRASASSSARPSTI